jgi:RNA polymerase sigma-70 factor (TIGR02960 family)
VSQDLISQARVGDGDAFAQLVEPYRRELQVHCYRILGTAADAEDALQETLLAAWQGLGGFEGRASIRSWLYRIATTRCLNMLRSAGRRPRTSPGPELTLPPPTRMGEALWLEPYPDLLLDGLVDTAPSPEARYEAREAVSLAFVTALQLLPPRQRAALVLRDVLGFSVREIARILQTTEDAAASALKRARATLARELSPAAEHEAPPTPNSAMEQDVAARLAGAFERGDVEGVVTLLTDDAWVRMPPVPLEYQGRELVTRFFSMSFRRGRRFRLVATRANGQPAFGLYVRDPHAGIAHANGLLVLTLAGERISVITRFDPGVLPRFGLPRTLPD